MVPLPEDEVHTHHWPLTLSPLASTSPTCSAFQRAQALSQLSGDLANERHLWKVKEGSRPLCLRASPQHFLPNCHSPWMLLVPATWPSSCFWQHPFLQVSPRQGGAQQCHCPVLLITQWPTIPVEFSDLLPSV